MVILALGSLYSHYIYTHTRSTIQFIFDMNVLKVEQFNGQEGTTWTAGLNKFSDMTAGELKQYRGYKNVPRSMKKGALEYTPPTRTTAYAPTVDWRNATNPTVLTPVKDQQQCGSCWAFSATASMESAGSIASDADAFILSPQQVRACQCGCVYV
jgi:KDEL-tailed cysteine endopeptidase